MMTGPGHTAHERLAALARRRRRDAESVGAMPATMRERLKAELVRQTEAGPRVPEPVPIPAVEASWRRWRAFAGLMGVGLGAAVVLVLMIRLGQESTRRSERRELASGAATPGLEADRGRGFTGIERAPAPVGLDAPPAAVTAAAPASRADEAPRVVILADASESPATKAVRNFEGMVRLRRSYAAAESNSPPTTIRLLRRFEVVRAPDRVEFRDQDGSVYAGRVEGGPGPKNGEVGDWVFEGRGTNVPSGKVVQITGHFGPLPDKREAKADGFMDLPFTGTAMIGEGQVVEVRAEPEL